MTEDEARAWLDANVPRGTVQLLERIVALLLDEMGRQNLISAASAEHVWTRHIVDSAQLLPLAGTTPRDWIDLGSGAGFPAMVIAAISDMPVVMVESRRKRIEFLEHMRDSLGFGARVRIEGRRAEMVPPATFGVISARAFAPLDRLLPLAHRFSGNGTCWVLPKGKSAASELEAARGSWQGNFRIEPSITDPEAAIIVAGQVQPRTRAQRERR